MKRKIHKHRVWVGLLRLIGIVFTCHSAFHSWSRYMLYESSNEQLRLRAGTDFWNGSKNISQIPKKIDSWPTFRFLTTILILIKKFWLQFLVVCWIWRSWKCLKCNSNFAKRSSKISSIKTRNKSGWSNPTIWKRQKSQKDHSVSQSECRIIKKNFWSNNRQYRFELLDRKFWSFVICEYFF